MYHALSPEHLSHDNYTFVPLCTNQFCNFDLVNNLRASPAHRNKTPLTSSRPAPEQNAAHIPTASAGTNRRSHPHGQRRNKAPLSIPTTSTGTKRRSHPHSQYRNKSPLTSPRPAPEQNAAHLTTASAGTKCRSASPPQRRNSSQFSTSACHEVQTTSRRQAKLRIS